MAFYQSPGVYVVEKDFSTIVPSVSTTIGGIVGDFESGPINTPKLITNQTELLEVFGKPSKTNYPVWWTAASFLQYTNKLWVVNVSKDADFNATASGTTVGNIKNIDDFNNLTNQELTTAGSFIAKVPFGRSTGAYNTAVADNQYNAGNSLAVMLVDANSWQQLLNWQNSASVKPVFDKLTAKAGGQDQRFSAKLGNRAPSQTRWAADAINIPDTFNDEVYVIVYNKNTYQVYEAFGKDSDLSKFSDALTVDPSNKMKKVNGYWKNYVTKYSNYIYANEIATSALETVSSTVLAWNTSGKDITRDSNKRFANLLLTEELFPFIYGLSGGVGSTGNVTITDLKAGYDLFKSPEDINVNLLLTANYADDVVKYVVESIAFQRKDAVVFASLSTAEVPSSGQYTMIGPNGRNGGRGPIATVEGLVAQRNNIAVADTEGSYLVIDTGFKQIVDRYQIGEPLVWVPLNGDIAGLCARTEWTNDAWWSPAGFNRGGIQNCIKVSFNPNLGQRDVLYESQINPVVSFPGQGTILYGDKTATEKPSAFDRINVRRLFIVLEKAIATASKYSLFEFNDSFTRNQFKNMVEPFLRDVQGRRGIQDFMVVCDESNNTGEVIDRNEFIADIYIKPARSINFIQLNFVATKTGVDFSTVMGG